MVSDDLICGYGKAAVSILDGIVNSDPSSPDPPVLLSSLDPALPYGGTLVLRPSAI